MKFFYLFYWDIKKKKQQIKINKLKNKKKAKKRMKWNERGSKFYY